MNNLVVEFLQGSHDEFKSSDFMENIFKKESDNYSGGGDDSKTLESTKSEEKTHLSIFVGNFSNAHSIEPQPQQIIKHQVPQGNPARTTADMGDNSSQVKESRGFFEEENDISQEETFHVDEEMIDIEP